MAKAVHRIAVLGGTGKEGKGLALRWAHAGHRLLLGSRDPARAAETAAEISRLVPEAPALIGTDNEAAAAAAEIVVLAVPYAAQQEVAVSALEHLRGKILIDVTVPLAPPKVGTVRLPPEGSAAVALQRRLGDDVRVVSAFQNVSAHHLLDLDHGLDCDVLVSADRAEDAELVIALAADAGMHGWHAGPLANAAVAEALTSVLITINRRYKVPAAGIRITGVASEPPR